MSNDLEKKQVELFKRIEREKQHAFDVALQGDNLLDLQFENDCMILLEPLEEWKNKAKSEDQKTKLDLMIKALMRLNIYANSKNIIAKRALAESIVDNRQKTKAVLEVSEMNKQMRQIQQQLDFHEKTK